MNHALLFLSLCKIKNLFPKKQEKNETLAFDFKLCFILTDKFLSKTGWGA